MRDAHASVPSIQNLHGADDVDVIASTITCGSNKWILIILEQSVLNEWAGFYQRLVETCQFYAKFSPISRA